MKQSLSAAQPCVADGFMLTLNTWNTCSIDASNSQTSRQGISTCIWDPIATLFGQHEQDIRGVSCLPCPPTPQIYPSWWPSNLQFGASGILAQNTSPTWHYSHTLQSLGHRLCFPTSSLPLFPCFCPAALLLCSSPSFTHWVSAETKHIAHPSDTSLVPVPLIDTYPFQQPPRDLGLNWEQRAFCDVSGVRAPAWAYTWIQSGPGTRLHMRLHMGPLWASVFISIKGGWEVIILTSIVIVILNDVIYPWLLYIPHYHLMEELLPFPSSHPFILDLGLHCPKESKAIAKMEREKS